MYKKKFKIIIYSLLATLFLIHYIILAVLGDFLNVGTLGSLLLSVVFFVMMCLVIKEKKIPKTKVVRHGSYLFFIWLCTFVIMIVLILKTNHEDPKNVDFLIVLGGGIKKGKPSPSLQRRLERAVQYLQHEGHVVTIVSGGKGKDEEISEAECMKDYLIGKGISPEKILVEDKAHSTNENIKFSKKIILNITKEMDDINIAVLSSDFHLFRAKMIASYYGLNVQCIPASTPWYVIPNNYFREYFALVKTIIFDLKCFMLQES